MRLTVLNAAIGTMFAVQLSPVAALGDTWESYREKHPFHLQEIALAKHPDSTWTIIISEPPEHFPKNVEEIDATLETAFGPEVVSNVEVRRHGVMLDGWVKDVTATLHFAGSRTLNASEIDSAVAALSRDLYGTSYRAYYRDLNADEAIDVDGAPMSVSVTPAELNRWALDDDTRFSLGDIDQSAPLLNLLEAGSPGVYYAENGRLVAWLLNPLTAFVEDKAPVPGGDWLERADFRRFALDTDLLLGAVRYGKTGMIAIIGQARTVSYDALPPLRLETLHRLAEAAGEEKSLGQSYERNHSFAGKIESGSYEGWDWAPIYLSDQLQDTEFGSLLNITDQILKSFSLAGDIEYLNFPYPKPELVAFGGRLDEKISEIYPETLGVLFNWNTSGSGSVLELPTHEVATPLRTGSLPMTYGSELAGSDMSFGKELATFEEQGWDYFSGLRDPNLTRVVQYTFLYQIFENWAVSHNDNFTTDALPGRRVEARFTALADHIVGQLVAGEAPEIDPFDLGEVPSDLATGDREDLDDLADLAGMMLSLQIADVGEKLEAFFTSAPDARDLLIQAIAAPRNLDISRADLAFAEIGTIMQNGSLSDDDVEREVKAALAQSREVRTVFALSLANEINPLIELYLTRAQANDAAVASVADVPGVGNIRTPTVVLSRDTAPLGFFSVGGHDLNSALPRIRPDDAVPRGEVRVDKLGENEIIIRLNPEDSLRSGTLGRVAARSTEEDPVLLGRELARSFDNAAPRSLAQALGDHVSLTEPALGALRPVNRVVDASLAARIGAVKGQVEAILSVGEVQLVLSRTEEGISMLSCCRPPVHEPHATMVATVEAAQRMLALGQHGNKIAFTGVRPSELAGLRRSIANKNADPTSLRGSAGSNGGGDGPPRFVGFFEGGGDPKSRPLLTLTRDKRDRAGRIMLDVAALSTRAKTNQIFERRDFADIPDFVRAELPEMGSVVEYFVGNFNGQAGPRLVEQSFELGVVTFGDKARALGENVLNQIFGAVLARQRSSELKGLMRDFRDEILETETDAGVILFFNGDGEIGWSMYSLWLPDLSSQDFSRG